MKINKVDSTFNFNQLDLEEPKGVQGGSHVAKIKVEKDDFYIKTDRCISRNGIITNGRKRYIDLMFSSNDDSFVEWVEKLEESIQKKIYEKSGEWFENELNPDDIENSFLASLKPFRSGKFYLLRCNLSPVSNLTTTGIKIYDDEGNDLSVEDVEENKKLICIININEIRFSSKNFQIDYYVKQIMVLNDSNINNKKLLLSDDSPQETKILATVENSVHDIKKYKTENEQKTHDDNADEICENIKIKTEEINEKNKNLDTILGETEEDKTITSDIANINFNNLEDFENSEPIHNNENKTIEETSNSLEEADCEKTQDSQEPEYGNHQKIEETSSLENPELNLEDCEVNFDFTGTNKEEITLKNPKDVYIEIYKMARKKAKETREKAVQAFLEVNNIKNKYDLTDIFDSDEEDEEESYLRTF